MSDETQSERVEQAAKALYLAYANAHTNSNAADWNAVDERHKEHIWRLHIRKVINGMLPL